MSQRPGSGSRKRSRKSSGKTKGTGGHGRRRLEGKGPTPKAEDRVYHKAYKAAQEKKRRQAAEQAQRHKHNSGRDVIAGRNSVLAALHEGIPGKTLYVFNRIDSDPRVREAVNRAAQLNIPMLEAGKPELDRLTDNAIHQGLALEIPPYDYADPADLLQVAYDAMQHPLLVALDGVTDPRNLGAVIRSSAAFGGHGVIIPERRSAAMTAAAWKTAAGAASQIRVAQVVNLTRTLTALKAEGVFVLGLDAQGDVELPSVQFGADPVCLVTGSEGKGLSRLVRETCDQIVSIPISAQTESLNASVATAVALYEMSVRRNGQARSRGGEYTKRRGQQ